MSTEIRGPHTLRAAQPTDSGLPVSWVIAVVLVVLAAITALGAVAS